MTLAGTVAINSTGGAIAFSGAIDAATSGSQGLTLESDAGNITVADKIGNSIRLGVLWIKKAADAAFTGSVKAASFEQDAGTGTTTFNGPQDYAGGFAFTGQNLTVDATWKIGGTTTVTNAGTFTLASGATTTAAGGFKQNGAGTNILAASISTTASPVSFATAVTLAGTVAINSTGGAIAFSGAIDAATSGSQGLTLESDAGNITVADKIGNSIRLGVLWIKKAADAAFTGSVKAASFEQDAGTVTTTFGGAQDYTGSFAFTGQNLTVDATWNIVGTTKVTNVGAFTLSTGAATTATGGFQQNGTGQNSLGANISTTASPVSFATAVTLAGDVAIGSTGGDIGFSSTIDGGFALTLTAGSGSILLSGAVGGSSPLASLSLNSANAGSPSAIDVVKTVRTTGNQSYNGETRLGGDLSTAAPGAGTVTFTSAAPVTLNAATITINTSATNGAVSFGSTVNPAAAGAQGLTLNAGTGSVSFAKAVGGTAQLGAILIQKAGDATFSGSVKTNSFEQDASSSAATTIFNGTQSYTGNFAFTGQALTVDATWTIGGTTTVTNAASFSLASGATTIAAGGFQQNGAGTSSLAANILTTANPVSFATAVTLAGAVAISSTGGDIGFSSTVDGGFGLTLSWGPEAYC